MENYIECPYLPIGYKISSNGVLINKRNKEIKPFTSNSGYLCFNLKDNGTQKGRFLHRALAFSFIPKIDGKNFVNHIDGNKLNNDLSNLEWCTQKENNQHARDSGLNKHKPLHYKGKFGADHNRSKKVIRLDTKEEFGSMSEASRKLGIAISSVAWSVKNKKPIYGMCFEFVRPTPN